MFTDVIALDNWSGSVAGFIGFRTRPSLNAIISSRSRAASHMQSSAFYLPWSFTTLERRIPSKCGSPFLGFTTPKTRNTAPASDDALGDRVFERCRGTLDRRRHRTHL